MTRPHRKAPGKEEERQLPASFPQQRTTGICVRANTWGYHSQPYPITDRDGTRLYCTFSHGEESTFRESLLLLGFVDHPRASQQPCEIVELLPLSPFNVAEAGESQRECVIFGLEESLRHQ